MKISNVFVILNKNFAPFANYIQPTLTKYLNLQCMLYLAALNQYASSNFLENTYKLNYMPCINNKCMPGYERGGI